MKNFIEYITISNFKSIRGLKMEGLSRINLLVGKPNVGKSNILEALGIFSLPYLKYYSKKKISNFIRFENKNEIFFDGKNENPISLKSNIGEYIVSTEGYINQPAPHGQNTRLHLLESYLGTLIFKIKIANLDYSVSVGNKGEIEFTGNIKEGDIPVKLYLFKQHNNSSKDKRNYLLPPSGVNLMDIIQNIPNLKNEIVNLFEEYNLNLLFDRADENLRITKPPQKGEIFSIPYHSIADTLQRVIFHKTAIASNRNSVLIFEEPEAHAFPPYISHITQEIIDSKSNQFIFSTHSPYVLNDFLENARDELSIFMVDYKNGETVANKLTKEDLDDIYGYGIDLFTNYETFLK